MESFQLTFCLMLLLVCGLGLSLPAFSMEGVGGERGLLASPARSRQNTESEYSTASSLDVSFTILHVSGVCPGGSTAGLGDTTLRLEFRSNGSNFQWVEAASGIPTDVGLYSITVSAGCGGVWSSGWCRRNMEEETATAGTSAGMCWSMGLSEPSL